MSDTLVKEKEIVLPKKVTIKASRGTGWLPAGSDGNHRFSKTAEHLTVQVDRSTGMLITGLSPEVEKELENKLHLKPGDLSRHNKEYWNKFKVVIPQAGALIKPKDNPSDEIIYRVMLVHQEVANSMAGYQRGDFPFARYVMHSEEEETATINHDINLKLEAYKRLGEMTETQKINFLKVYGKNPGKDASLDFITAQAGKIVDAEPKLFLNTINSPNYKDTIFIKTCLEKGVLKEVQGKYMRPGGEILAYSFDQLIDFLGNKDNHEVRGSLLAQLQAIG